MSVFAQSNVAFQNETPRYVEGIASTSVSEMRPKRARVPENRSRWARELEGRFNDLVSLPRGWDGYAGRPVSFSVARFAANLIERLCVEISPMPQLVSSATSTTGFWGAVGAVPAPQLVPGGDGSLQMEWHVNQYDLEIDVLAPYEVHATRYNHLNGREEELDAQTDFTELAEWVAALGVKRGRRQAAAG